MRHHRLLVGGVSHYSVIEIALPHLHDEVDFLPADVVAISRQNIGMLAIQVYLHLIDEELQLELALPKGLDRCDQSRVVGYRLDDISRLAFAE